MLQHFDGGDAAAFGQLLEAAEQLAAAGDVFFSELHFAFRLGDLGGFDFERRFVGGVCFRQTLLVRLQILAHRLLLGVPAANLIRTQNVERVAGLHALSHSRAHLADHEQTRRLDRIGAARRNEHERTGHCLRQFDTIAASRATPNMPMNNHAVARMNHGGGSCGNISDSRSHCVLLQEVGRHR